MSKNKSITVSCTVNAPVEKVWKMWNEPEDIKKWAFASDTWEAPSSENDLRTGGHFKTRMAAKDGSAAFDFAGEYTEVEPLKVIAYKMGDERTVRVVFEEKGDSTTVTETFDMENMNPEEMQRAGWQAILDNFKKHVELH